MSELANLLLHSTVASIIAGAVVALGALDAVLICSRLLRFVAREWRERLREDGADWRRFFGGG
jgi:hypothetical protein